MQKALLSALLMPHAALKRMQDEGRFTEQMAMQEELKTYPLGDVWDHFCETQGVPVRGRLAGRRGEVFREGVPAACVSQGTGRRFGILVGEKEKEDEELFLGVDNGHPLPARRLCDKDGKDRGGVFTRPAF